MSPPERSNAPRPKVTAAGIGGALTTVLVYLLGLAGLDVSPEVAAAITTLIAFGAGYFRKEDV